MRTILLVVAILSIIAALAMLLQVVINFRESRTAPYHTIRRNAVRRAMRQFGFTIAFAAVAVGVFIIRQNASGSIDFPAIALGDAEPTATATQIPDLPPTITPQPEPSITPAASATVTPTMALVPTNTAEPQTIRVNIYEVSTGITNNLLPAGAGTQFEAGLTRIYYWVEYEQMQDGNQWRQVLLVNGETILDDELAWEQGEEGTAYYFLDAPDGWPAGNYEIRVFTGDQLNDAARFSLR